jgi:hypothetical protein
MAKQQIKLKSPKEFFPSPTPTTAIEDVKREIRKNDDGLLDERQLREQEDWSFLANRAVGAEGE